MTPSGHQEFRADIQLLRGLAILLVFVFHLNSTALPAGFLGVDIFFVISGFLMTALYGNASNFNSGDFFTRRARRILPAYFLTILCVLAVSFLTVLPHELAQIAGHSIYSSLMLANVGHWLDESYFNSATFRPALHLWSLGVEIQFYALFPIVVWTHAHAPRTLILLSAMSFVLCVVIAGVSPKTSFFLLPFRFWEFMAGFYAAKSLTTPQLPSTDRLHRWIAAGALGLLAVIPLASIPENQHPALAALLTCGCTAAALVLGLPRRVADFPVGRAIVLLGKYSYSVYLVHFPVLAFYFYSPFGGDVRQSATASDAAIVIAVTGLLSYALFYLVEAPARNLKLRIGYAPVLTVCALVCLGVAAEAPPLQRLRFTSLQNVILNSWFDREEYRCGKLARVLDPFPASCVLTEQRGGSSLLLVGNSHADALKASLRELARRHGAGLRLMKSNCSLGRPQCGVSDVVAEVLSTGVDTVLVHDSPDATDGVALDALVEAGAKHSFDVVLIDPVPVWSVSVPQALFRKTLNQDTGALPHQTLSDYYARNARFLSQVNAISSPNFYRERIARAFCDPECHFATTSGTPFYFDGSHLTLTGARHAEAALESIFAFVEKRRRDTAVSGRSRQASQ